MLHTHCVYKAWHWPPAKAVCGHPDQCWSFNNGAERKQPSAVHKTACTGMIFHFQGAGSVQNNQKQRKDQKKKKLEFKKLSVAWSELREAFFFFLKTRETSKIGKARRSVCDILNCQQSSTAQLIVFFLGRKKMYLREGLCFREAPYRCFSLLYIVPAI